MMVRVTDQLLDESCLHYDVGILTIVFFPYLYSLPLSFLCSLSFSIPLIRIQWSNKLKAAEKGSMELLLGSYKSVVSSKDKVRETDWRVYLGCFAERTE